MTTATDFRQPDIEIYIRPITTADLNAWLEQHFDAQQQLQSSNKLARYQLTLGANTIPLTALAKAAGAFTCLWFDSSHTPWPTDLDCAQDAARHFNQEVRCSAGGWQEGDEPDAWLSVTPDGCETIEWKGN